MTLEAVIYQQDLFMNGYKDYNYSMVYGAYQENTLQEESSHHQVQNARNWDSPAATHNTSSSSEETCGGDEFFGARGEVMFEATAAAGDGRRKRRRAKTVKNKEEMESQRMTHIAVERNRRRQMNDYLAVLRSLMPPSYAQRGDQASIVGGAINFVKELEQLLQFLEAHKLTGQHTPMVNTASTVFSTFFTFPQYSMSPPSAAPGSSHAVEKRSDVADIEVSMVESHANVKILSRRRPKQLLKLLAGFQSLSLTVLHLNITAVGRSSMLYSFSVKVEDESELSTVNEIATAVHEIIQRDYQSTSGGPHAVT